MKESKRTTLRVLYSIVFVLGLMSLLNETRATGEALEKFKLILSLDPASVIGAGVAILALIGFAVLLLSEHRGTTKHP